MAYRLLYRQLNNGIQITVQKTKQWHTEHYRKLNNGIQNTVQKTKQWRTEN